jgi:hypothetical protein
VGGADTYAGGTLFVNGGEYMHEDGRFKVFVGQ